jgi:hypothetical protein
VFGRFEVEGLDFSNAAWETVERIFRKGLNVTTEATQTAELLGPVALFPFRGTVHDDDPQTK